MNRPFGGILLIDKPSGPTSHDVVARVRATLAPGARGPDRVRVGHAGTLDPLATGLLVVLVGKGTRLAPFLSGLDKTYTAEVRFGVATDTLDREGAVTDVSPVPPTLGGLDAALAALTGDIAQVPPVYSALKRDGQALYRRARRGEEMDAPAPRRVKIDRLVARDAVWGVAPATAVADDLPPAPDGRIYGLTLDIACGSGTYVRSLARDLALALGTVGHLHALRRTSVGPFDLAAAVPLTAFMSAAAPASHLIPLGAALPHLAAHTLTAAQAELLQRTGRLEADWLPATLTSAPLACLLDPAGRLAAVVRGGDRLELAAVFPVQED